MLREEDLCEYWDLLARYRNASARVQKTMLAVSIPLLYHSTTSPKLKAALESFRAAEWIKHYRPNEIVNPCLEVHK